MNLIEITPQANGAHENRDSPWETAVPEGWAVIPEGLPLPQSFPFVDIEVTEQDGVMVVTSMAAREMPPVDEPEREPTIKEQLETLQGIVNDVDTMDVDFEYRLTLLELGITGNE